MKTNLLRTRPIILSLFVAMILLGKGTSAQTIGFSHQRVNLQLKNAAVVIPVGPTKRPVGIKGAGTEVVTDSKTAVTRGLIKGKYIPQNFQVLSSKKFNISIMSQPRSLFPETEVIPTRMIYLTDIIYTASQQ